MRKLSRAKHKSSRKVAAQTATFSFSKVVVLTTLLSFATSADAAGDCEVRASKHPEVANRSVVIAFPDGRELTIVGHNHGVRTAAEVVLQLAGRSPEEASNEDYVGDLEFQLEQKPDAARDSKQDLTFLKKYLEQNPHAQFVGLEGTPETVRNQFTYYERVRTALSKQRALRGLKPSPLDVDIQTYAYGAASYLKMIEPGRFKGRSIIGFEEKAAGDVYLKAESAFQQEVERLQSTRTVSQAGLLTLQKWLIDVMDEYPTYRAENDDAKILAQLKPRFKSPEWAAAEKFVRSRLSVLKAMKARDESDVSNLLKQEKSGVVFVGRDHLRSFETLLKKACEAKLERSAGGGARGSTAAGSGR